MIELVHALVDDGVVAWIGDVQKWFCPLCETRLELGSEALAFVQSPGRVPMPVVVHSECREGALLRGKLSKAWDGLDTSARKRAVERLDWVYKEWTWELRKNLPEPDPKPAAAAAPAGS